MKKYRQNIINSLAFRTITPVVAVILLTGLGLYTFVLRSVSDFADRHIREAFSGRARNIYSLCDNSLSELLKKGEAGNERAVNVRKGLTIGIVEDFMRQNNLMGIITESGRDVLSTCCLSAGFAGASKRNLKLNEVSSFEFGGKAYYLYAMHFEPWNWRIVLIKDAAEYSVLVRRVRFAYAVTGISLCAAALLLIFYFNGTIKKPLSEIIAPLKKGDLPVYRGKIREFAFMSESIGQMIESLREKEAEKERLMQKVIQEQKLESIGLLANGIAHNFNNILVGVLGYASLLRIRLEGMKKNARPFQEDLLAEYLKYIDTIESSAQRAGNLATELASLAKGRPSIQLNASSCDINRLIAELRKLLVNTFPKNIEIKAELADNLPPIQGDPSELEQAVLNICLNSKDAMHEGGSLTFRTFRSVLPGTDPRYPSVPPGTYVKIEVADTGIGMDHEKLDRIFEPFFTTKPGDKGSGLGLSIAYAIIKAHNGYITAESNPGSGSTFTVHLPAPR